MAPGLLDGVGKFVKYFEDDNHWVSLPYDTGVPAWLPADLDCETKFTDIKLSKDFSERVKQQLAEGKQF